MFIHEFGISSYLNMLFNNILAVKHYLKYCPDMFTDFLLTLQEWAFEKEQWKHSNNKNAEEFR